MDQTPSSQRLAASSGATSNHPHQNGHAETSNGHGNGVSTRLPDAAALAARFERDFGANSSFIFELLDLYLSSPKLVSEQWAAYFDAILPEVNAAPREASSAAPRAESGTAGMLSPASAVDSALAVKVRTLVEAYRTWGHLRAHINPLTKGVVQLPDSADLELGAHDLRERDLDETVPTFGVLSEQRASLRELVAALQAQYCGSTGWEYTHLINGEEREFLRSRIESVPAPYAPELRKHLLQKLVDAETMESELHRRYVGQKRFSLQGGETLMPMLDRLLERGAELNAREVIIGMAHRGRLNVLVNTVGKPLAHIFNEFEDRSMAASAGAGDVKYHLGYSSVQRTPGGKEVLVSLAPNPSHLEFVNVIVDGMARARQDLSYDRQRTAVVPLVLHGDAAFVGQGTVWEAFNMSRLEGYTTGGTVHIVINNQLGFTTTPDEARSSPYCTDFAKAVQAPVFHVNTEDVEGACRAIEIAIEFRQKYQRDVVVDLYCYRKYGHNEGDDPTFTQPVLYSEITSKKLTSAGYANELKEQGIITDADYQQCFADYKARFESAAQESARTVPGEACAVHGRLRVPTPQTGVDRATLKRIAESYLQYPQGFTPHPKLVRILEKRLEALEQGEGIDWGLAESLAFGSLLLEGHGIRLSGQDCGRATFSHRHAVLDDHEKAQIYVPLRNFARAGCSFEVYNSPLSEQAVLGFDLGYAHVAENALVMWEAQFGDFANGAQVIIDQFLSSSEAKWNYRSGLVMLLPHGYEGQGPEHSSARLERYLQLCAEGNMVVAYPSNAAQYFHLLRRHGLMAIKRPMVVMTPKSLLRHLPASAQIGALTEGQFETVLEDDFTPENGKVDAVVFCTGKVYYDLHTALSEQKGLSERKGAKVKLVRIEQLYPFPQFEVKKVMKGCEKAKLFWVQEEPQNMGSWNYIEPYLRAKVGPEVHYIGRPVSASTAAGSSRRHGVEQKQIVDELLGQLKLS